MIKCHATVLLLSLVVASPTVANTLSFKCSISTRASNAPAILILALDQDAKKMNWQADTHN